jgi:CHAT domain-containing protein
MIWKQKHPAKHPLYLWLMLGLTASFTQLRGDNSEPAAEQLMTAGQAAYDRGAFEDALTQWRQAQRLFAAKCDTNGQVSALINLASVHQAVGQQRLAFQALEQAGKLAAHSPNQRARLATRNELGIVCGCLNQYQRAMQTLRDTLAASREQGDSKMTATVLNNLGNLLAAQDETDDALNAFKESASLAQQVTNRTLAAKAFANAAAVAAQAVRDEDAERLSQAALEALDGQPPTHDLALLYLRCGQTDWRRQQARPRNETQLLPRAGRSYEQALAIAEELKDTRAMSYALGYLGQLRAAEGNTAVALGLSRRAAFAAQEAQMPDALYRWEWQTGRLHRAQGNREAAIAAYQRAVQTLKPIRRDLLFSYGLADTGFREAVSPVFYELTDLLLERADTAKDAAEEQRILREACDTVELLKSFELENYLQDECMDLLRTKAARIENIDPKTAVVYIISMPDRTELLVGIGPKLKRVKVPVGAVQLTAEVQAYRSHLQRRTTNEHLGEARQLYQWLITPIRGLLTSAGIETLVFVPDGALRTIPMSALQDGQQFLIEQFAIAVSPGLTLLEPQPIQRSRVRALEAGVSEAIQNRAPLPNVRDEVQAVQKAFGGTTLMDREFVWPTLQKVFASSQYQIVHFATHGQIDSDASKSYILTYNGKLTFDQLEELIRPSQFRGRAVELLALSACETATGDDRAALGLAGVALKAGARSVLATLWSVHDESTAILIGEFYSQLAGNPTISKARALQLAQLKVLHDPRFEHPGYWAPYLIIGNWLGTSPHTTTASRYARLSAFILHPSSFILQVARRDDGSRRRIRAAQGKSVASSTAPWIAVTGPNRLRATATASNTCSPSTRRSPLRWSRQRS